MSEYQMMLGVNLFSSFFTLWTLVQVALRVSYMLPEVEVVCNLDISGLCLLTTFMEPSYPHCSLHYT